MGRVREIRGNKSQSITEISTWIYVHKWNRQVSGVGGGFLSKLTLHPFWS